MKPKIKKSLFALIALCILGGTGFAAYNYSGEIKNIFSKGYSSSYTLEEVNEKILSLQQKIVEDIEETYNNTLTKSQSQRVTGKMGIKLEANTPVGGGSGNILVENLDLQYTPTGVDMLVNGLSAIGEMQVFGEKVGGNIELGEGHLITNASGSYIKAKDLVLDTSDLGQELLPKEIVMTLNKLSAAGKYIDLSENFLYDILEAQIIDISERNKELNSDILEFLKQKPLFTAYKQDETKYHIAPSQDGCSFMLKVGAKQAGAPLKDCTDENYELVTGIFLKSDFHEVKNFYIELNATKVHYVVDIIASNPQEDTLKVEIETGFEGTVSLTQQESSKMYMRINNENITGSGILIEQNGSDINGYVDIGSPKYNLDTNIVISGTTDNIALNGDYSYTSPEQISNRSIQILSGVEVSGTMIALFTDTNYSFNATNNIIGKDQAYSGEMILDINGKSDGDKNSGEMQMSGKMKTGESATPISGDIKMSWDTETSKNLAKGDINYSLDVPNIASGKYEINYDFKISDTLNSKFETPTSILPQKNLNSLIMLNKRIADKEKIAATKKKIKDLENGNNTFSSREIGALNSKTSSDTRSIASAIEVDISTTGKNLDSYIINSKQYPTSNSGTLYVGNINYSGLKLEADNFTSPIGKDYEMRVLKINLDGKIRSYYEISGFRIMNNSLERLVRGNYISNDLPEIKSLFDIELK